MASLTLLVTQLQADNTQEIQKLKAEIAQLQEKTDTLIDETSNLQTGFTFNEVDTTKSHSELLNDLRCICFDTYIGPHQNLRTTQCKEWSQNYKKKK